MPRELPDKSDRDYLYDMLDSARMALGYVVGMTWEQFREDQRTRDAVVRRLEILGEAGRRLSDVFRAEHAAVPWRKITGLRNVIAHEYDRVELEIVWRILQVDLPALADQLAGLLSGYGD